MTDKEYRGMTNEPQPCLCETLSVTDRAWSLDLEALNELLVHFDVADTNIRISVVCTICGEELLDTNKYVVTSEEVVDAQT